MLRLTSAPVFPTNQPSNSLVASTVEGGGSQTASEQILMNFTFVGWMRTTYEYNHLQVMGNVIFLGEVIPIIWQNFTLVLYHVCFFLVEPCNRSSLLGSHVCTRIKYDPLHRAASTPKSL